MGDRHRLLVLATLACSLLDCSVAEADTVRAASCSQEDVQKAIDAAHDGDTIAIPAGTATWITEDANPAAAAVTLR